VFKGVSYHSDARKWRAQITSYGEHEHLGLFNTPEEAALAYNNAAIDHYGEFAFLNEVGKC
jgi:hypothetical protein